MISLTRLNGERIALNPELIERGEETPDTVLTLVNGTKYVVHQSLDEVIERVKFHRAAILALSRRIVVERAQDPEPRLTLLPGIIEWSDDGLDPDGDDDPDPTDDHGDHHHPSFPDWAGR